MYAHEQVPYIPTWSSHTLAVTSLLLARIKSHGRVAAAFTANIPSIGYGNAPFTVQSVENIEAYMKREKPNWTEAIEKMKANTEDKDIDKAVEYLEKGMLKTDRVFLPKEAACQKGLENLTKVIIEIAGGAQQFAEPVKEEWNGRIDLVTPDSKGSNAGRIYGNKHAHHQIGGDGHPEGAHHGHHGHHGNCRCHGTYGTK